MSDQPVPDQPMTGLLRVVVRNGEKHLEPIPIPEDAATRDYVLSIRDGLPTYVPADEIGRKKPQ